MNEEADRELEGLIHGYLDETLADPEAQRLRDLLLADRRHLDQFIRGVDLHGVLAGLRSEAEPGRQPEGAIRPEGGAPEPGPGASIATFKARLNHRLQAAADPRFPGPRSRGVPRLLKLVSSLAAAAGFIVLGNAFSLDAPGPSAPGDPASVDRVTDGVELQLRSARERSVDALGAASSDRKPQPEKGETDLLARSKLGLQDSSVGGDRDAAGAESYAIVAFKKERPADAPTAAASLPLPMTPAPAGVKVPPESEGVTAGTRPPPWIPSAEDKVQIATAATAVSPVEEFEERRVQESRKIVRNAEASIEVDSYEAAYAKLLDLVGAEKGYVADGDIQKMPNGKIQARVTARIPAERFDAVLGRLKEFGTLKYLNLKAEDVSKAYFDHQAHLKSKELLLERLKALLKEAKGTAKELMEVEVQIGATQEAIDGIKGELRYYDAVVSMSTLILGLVEKDLRQPFEVIQTLQSTIGLTARQVEDAYAKAQVEITEAGGQVVDSKMTRQSDGSAMGSIRARVDAEKFPALRESLKKLGHVTDDTVNQQKTARGGQEDAPKPNAPLRKEQAVIDVSISTPPVLVTSRARIVLEVDHVSSAYPAARTLVDGAGGKVTSGSLTGRENGAKASMTAQIDADKFSGLVEHLKAAGRVKDATVRQDLPAESPEGASGIFRERSEIDLTLVSPPQLIDDEHGIGRTVRDTFASSWKGILWSVEKLVVGISVAGPWLGLALVGWIVWRRLRKKKPATT